jgi:hypothetical protein
MNLILDFAVPKTRGFFHYFSQGRLNIVDTLAGGSLVLGLALWWNGLPRWFFLIAFISWRLAYNVGLGVLLRWQSDSEWFTEIIRDWSKNNTELLGDWVKPAIRAKMDRDYSFSSMPPEYNAWLVFRLLVDLVLFHDCISYGLFALAYGQFCLHSIGDLLRIMAGLSLIIFNAWVKSDAHRVVKDYAWYWGDFFFFLVEGELVFDGVFELAPHPMYSLGYTWYYGVSLLCKSHTVFFVGLAAHLLQLAFLVIVEAPHMEKIYGNKAKEPRERAGGRDSWGSRDGRGGRGGMILFFGFDWQRATDLITAFFVGSTILIHSLGVLPESLVVIECIIWRLIHSGIVGLVLWGEGRRKSWTRHFIKYGGAPIEAFDNWKALYNSTLLMNYTMYIITAVYLYRQPVQWMEEGILLRHTLGVMMMALQVWTDWSVYAVLGEYGWFYGDFFIPPRIATPTYGGIYRYLNNPESVVGHAAYWGLALIVNEWRLWMLVGLVMITNYALLVGVEVPHMRRVYGEKVRRVSGFEKTFINVSKSIPGAKTISKITRSLMGRAPVAEKTSKSIGLDLAWLVFLIKRIFLWRNHLRGGTLGNPTIRMNKSEYDLGEPIQFSPDSTEIEEIAIVNETGIPHIVSLSSLKTPSEALATALQVTFKIPAQFLPWKTGQFELHVLVGHNSIAHSNIFTIKSDPVDDLNCNAVSKRLSVLIVPITPADTLGSLHPDDPLFVRLSEVIYSLYDVEFDPLVLFRFAHNIDVLAEHIIDSVSFLHDTSTTKS